MAHQNFSVHVRLPPRELFIGFFDKPVHTIPPTAPENSWVQPFTIPTSIFHELLDIKVPAAIAAIYLVSVISLNRLNNSRQNRPWKFAKTSAFQGIVLIHNIFLALFSAWTFYGLCYSIKNCWPSKTELNFLPQLADALCRISNQDWSYTSLSHEPNRLWDDGFAYFGWLYYLSKFYELFDTFIILAKGKRSSILQTYHHTGVMFCMWATIRYMSAPALVGIFFNSAIHALMYSYFAWTSLGLPVYGLVKQTLTALQIAQFVVGCTICCCYLFIEYDTLGYRPGYHTTHEGTAKSALITPEFYLHGTGQSPQAHRAPCVRNSREAFAAWLSTLYCLPLTYLFLCFFSCSYLKKAKCDTK